MSDKKQSTGHRPAILEDFAALADGTRCRILLILEHQELTVSDLCTVLQLPQSTASRHLKALTDAGWINAQAEGTRRLYRFLPADLDPAARELWVLARKQLQPSAGARQDARRLESVLAARRSRSRRFFEAAAQEWDRLRDELFGSRFHLLALLGLLPREQTVADLGCGTGRIAEALAPHVRRVIAVDDSAAMLDAARERLAGEGNVELRQGQLETLPIDAGEVDAATLVLVLHHVAEPGRVMAEVARVLRPGGRLLVVDMLPHDRVAYQHQMGHVWLGFEEPQMERWLAAAGLHATAFRALPAETAARGPALFVLTAESIQRGTTLKRSAG